MIGVCFFFEEGASSETHPGIITNWYMTGNAWRINQLYFIDRTKNAGRTWKPSAVQGFPGPKVPVTRYEDFSKLYNEWPAKYVFLEVKKQAPGPTFRTARNLVSYVHPQDDVIYVFGGEFWGGLKVSGKDISGDWVYVPNEGPGSGLQTAAIVLYDRRVKSAGIRIDVKSKEEAALARRDLAAMTSARERAVRDLLIWKEAAGNHAKTIAQRLAADRAALAKVEREDGG